MFYLIVTNDEKLVRLAREYGAGVFTANQCPEGAISVATQKTSGNSLKTYELLQALNVKPNVKGYNYLKFVMEKCEADPEYHNRSFTKEIYPECAGEFKTTATRVERAIFSALSSSFEEVPEKYSVIFGREFKKKPTTSEFIGCVAAYFANNK